jgi:hypothetical protein
MQTESHADGSCLCGAVQFTLALPSKWCAHCHCSRCRRAHAAPFVTFVGIDRARFHLRAGEEHLRRYRHEEGGLHSARACQICGSTLLFESSRWPDEVHVARAAIPGPIDREPQAHCFYSDRAPWLQVKDTLPRRGGESGVEPLPDEP